MKREQKEERILFTRETKEQICEKSNWKCCHCGEKLVIGDNFTIEHVIPITKGGSNDINNLVGLCRVCNKQKGALIWDMSYYPFLKSFESKKLQLVLDSYNKEFSHLSKKNLFLTDVFKCGAVVGVRNRGMSRSVVQKVLVYKAVYSDLDDVYNFITYYTDYFKIKNTNDMSMKEYVSYIFQNGAFYFTRAKNGKINMVIPCVLHKYNGEDSFKKGDSEDISAVSIGAVAISPSISFKNSTNSVYFETLLSNFIYNFLEGVQEPFGCYMDLYYNVRDTRIGGILRSGNFLTHLSTKSESEDIVHCFGKVYNSKVQRVCDNYESNGYSSFEEAINDILESSNEMLCQLITD